MIVCSMSTTHEHPAAASSVETMVYDSSISSLLQLVALGASMRTFDLPQTMSRYGFINPNPSLPLQTKRRRIKKRKEKFKALPS